LFTQDGRVAYFALRRAARRIGGQTAPQVIGRRLLCVVRELIGKVLVDVGTVRQGPHTSRELSPEGHALNPPR
jgi:hypothetical protein